MKSHIAGCMSCGWCGKYYTFMMEESWQKTIPPQSSLISKFREQRETVVKKCSDWNCAGATATQQVQWLLCISKTYCLELFPLYKLEENLRKIAWIFYNKIECWCWQSSLMGYSVFVFLPLSLQFPFLYRSCSVANMFTVFSIRFHCKRLTLPHCSSGWNALNHLFPHHGTISPVMVRIYVLHLYRFYCFTLKLPCRAFLYFQCLLPKMHCRYFE